MFQIPRTTLRSLRRDIRHALEVTSPKRAPALTLRVVQGLLVAQASTDRVAVEYRLPSLTSATQTDLSITVPCDALRACEGRTQETVTFERCDDQNDQILVQWPDQGVPKKLAVATTEPVDMPIPPARFHAVDRRFLAAMAEASETTTKDSLRFALDCIRLRGCDGQIAASDGYQALLQTGFSFPWSDEILVTSSQALQSPDVRDAPQVEIGRSDDWFFLRLNRQTLALRIETTRRFPNMDQQIPSDRSVGTTLKLSCGDATFLEKFLSRLPGAAASHSPVTVDMNGVVAIRATDEDNLNPVELVLDHSRRDGDELRVQTDRTYLSRAVRLGFRDLCLSHSQTPAFCRDASRIYLWALLSGDDAIPADDAMPRIHSALHTSNVPKPDPSASSNSKPERPSAHMTNNTTNNTAFSQTPSTRSSSVRKPVRETLSPSSAEAEAASRNTDEPPRSPLAQAEIVRDSLTQALADVRDLITAIKRSQKQNRLVETTLRSLKQLEHIGS